MGQNLHANMKRFAEILTYMYVNLYYSNMKTFNLIINFVALFQRLFYLCNLGQPKVPLNLSHARMQIFPNLANPHRKSDPKQFQKATYM